jgi:PAS domain S-box-containing protein
MKPIMRDTLIENRRNTRQSKLTRVLLIVNEPNQAQRIQICLRQFKDIPLEVMRSGAPGEAPKKFIDTRSRDMSFEVTWVMSLDEALKKIAEFHFDILVLDLLQLDPQGLSAIRQARAANNALPVIMLINNEDIDSNQPGADDYVVKDESGYEGLIRVMRNVLNRINSEETFNPLFVAALKATSNAVLIANKDARIEWTNPAFTQLTGYTFQESLGQLPVELLKSDLHDDSFYQHMWQKILNEEHWQGEIVNKRKDGSLYNADMTISPVLNKYGLLAGYVQIQRDITDSVVRLAISEALQQNSPLDERFKKVLNIIFDVKAFNLQRKGGVFLRVKGENYLTLFVVQGEFSAEFIEKETCISCGSCLCGRVAISGKVLVSDYCFIDAHNQHKFTDMQAHGHFIIPITSGEEVLGVLFLYTDPLQSESLLAMLKQVGEMMALSLRQEEAKTALEMARDMAMKTSLVKSEFLANMSHEIRTPMNGVLGMLDLLCETKMTPTQRDWATTAHSSAEVLLEIINDILDLSKLEAGKFELERVDFNLVDLVEDICALLAGRAHVKGLELNCLLPVLMPLTWRGDPMRIRQVLTNLIGNAVKFTEQGEVSVRIILPSGADSLDDLRFEVCDTGIGVSLEAQPELFKSFSQEDSSTSRRFGGSGLGLFISKKLVDLMGGNIGMNSAPNAGSCFWFTLPLEQCNSEVTPELSYDLSGKRTLVVDDNATNRNILVNYLSNWGLEVSEVDNGGTALMQLQTSALQGLTYDLIVLDMHMPVMDGLTLAKCLVQIPALARIPIILLSSSDQLDIVDYQNTGIVQRLLKPVRQLQLFDAIVNALQQVSEATLKTALPEIKLPSYHDKKVLVVEDNKINQKVIIARLAKFNIVPDLAENGQLALVKLAQYSYDLILMDCHMPVMDGYIATRELRLLEESRRLPRQTVIALTANALEGEREKCLEAGMDDYLTKPIITKQLIEMLAYRLGSLPTENTTTLCDENSALAERGHMAWDRSVTLDHLEGDDDLLTELIALFLIESPKQLHELSRFQAEGNITELANVAHAIKGTIAHFYVATATDCVSLLEKTARSGQSADYQGMTEVVIKAVTDLIDNLQPAKDTVISKN